MKDITSDNDQLHDELFNIPLCFRVIGVGDATADIIEHINATGYEGVSGIVVNAPYDCQPTDADKMVIIVSRGSEPHANDIARRFYDAGVLTIGLLENADARCYDSVVTNASPADYLDIIDSILKPLMSVGIVHFSFDDLKSTFVDSKHFMCLSATGEGSERVTQAIEKIISSLTYDHINAIENLSVFLYYNKEGKKPLVTKEIMILSDFINTLPKNIEIIWAVYSDPNLDETKAKLTLLASGKNL